MFGKKRVKPWFMSTLFNLFAISLLYRLARNFLSLAEKQGAKNKIQKDRAKKRI
ncbi:MAG: hypothetical protein LBI42_15365 [Chitinispirillales bacterium]|nr:hypothetical protein [Chitinispirillales bacterium]